MIAVEIVKVGDSVTIEEKKAKVADLRPIDDVFFEVLASEKSVCREMLRTIMEDPGLEVIDVIVQSSERNIYGRSVRLDALCTLSNGSKVNIEVQRSDNDDHLKRVRFNAASITVKDSEAGTDFENIPELYIVYISEFDFLNGGKTIYHVDKVLRETGVVIDDGLHEMYINTVVDDGSDIADLMSCFTKKMVNNPKFPVLSDNVNKLKNTEGGLDSMCEVMKKYEDAAWMRGMQLGKAEGMQLGKAEGMKLEQINIASKMLKDGMPPEIVVKYSGLSIDEVLQLDEKGNSIFA